MRKFFISAAIVTGLTFGIGGVTSFANDTGMKQTEMRENTKGMTQISGQITDIKGDSFTVTDQNGKTHKVIPAEPSELAKINVGDNVTVELNKNGRAAAINKTDATGTSDTMQGGSEEGNQNQDNGQ